MRLHKYNILITVSLFLISQSCWAMDDKEGKNENLISIKQEEKLLTEKEVLEIKKDLSNQSPENLYKLGVFYEYDKQYKNATEAQQWYRRAKRVKHVGAGFRYYLLKAESLIKCIDQEEKNSKQKVFYFKLCSSCLCEKDKSLKREACNARDKLEKVCENKEVNQTDEDKKRIQSVKSSLMRFNKKEISMSYYPNGSNENLSSNKSSKFSSQTLSEKKDDSTEEHEEEQKEIIEDQEIIQNNAIEFNIDLNLEKK